MIDLKSLSARVIASCFLATMIAMPMMASAADTEKPVASAIEPAADAGDTANPPEVAESNPGALMEPEGLTEDGAKALEASSDAKSSPEEVEKNLTGAVGELVAAIRSGDWRLVAAIALSLFMVMGAKFRDRIPFFKTKRGGVASALLLSTAGGLATSLFANAAIDFTMFLRAAEVGILAIGGYVGLKTLIWPSDKNPG